MTDPSEPVRLEVESVVDAIEESEETVQTPELEDQDPDDDSGPVPDC